MRLWTLHPTYLDGVGLVALWREALLARAVLAGATRGYRHHPQLIRFRAHRDPVAIIDRYLAGVYEEACRRGYRFNERKLGRAPASVRITETRGQLNAEWSHLLGKLRERDPERHALLGGAARIPPELPSQLSGASVYPFGHAVEDLARRFGVSLS